MDSLFCNLKKNNSFKLAKHGFKRIDGLDPAEGMLAVARKKNVYGRLICEFMSDKRLPIENGKLLESSKPPLVNIVS